MVQQADSKKQIQSASAISLLDVQKVDSHLLIVSPRMTKAGVDQVLLIISCAISHIELRCLMCYSVRKCQKLNVVSY